MPPQAWGSQGKSYGHGGGDYGRGNNHSGHAQGGYQNQSHGNGGHYDTYGYQQYPGAYPMSGGGPRQDSYGAGPRLSERISGYAPPGLDRSLADSMASSRSGKPILEPGPGSRRGGRTSGPPPPPPPNAKEDPRAAAGKKLSYYDMDSVAEGDVELSY